MDKLISNFEIQLKILKEHYEKSLTDPDFITEVCVKLNLLVGTKDSLFLKLQQVTNLKVRSGLKSDPNANLSTDEFMEIFAVEDTKPNGKSLTKRELISAICKSMGGVHVSFSIDEELSKLIENFESITINGKTILVLEIHTTARTIIKQGEDFLKKSKESFFIPNQQNVKARKLTKEGKYAEALVFYSQAIIEVKKTYGDDYYQLGVLYANMSIAYLGQGTETAAKESYEILQKAMTIFITSFGEDHEEVVLCKAKVAHSLTTMQGRRKDELAMENYRESLKLLKEVCKFYSDKYGAESRKTGMYYSDLAGAYGFIQDYPNSEIFYKKALSIVLPIGNEDDVDIAIINNNYGWLLFELCRYRESSLLFKKSLDSRVILLAPNHPQTVAVRRAYELSKSHERK